MSKDLTGVSAIVLAAGAGSRFGSGKLLARLGGQPIIEAVLDNLRDAPVDEVIVVIGADTKRLRVICERYGVRIVENKEASPRQSSPGCGRVMGRLRWSCSGTSRSSGPGL